MISKDRIDKHRLTASPTVVAVVAFIIMIVVGKLANSVPVTIAEDFVVVPTHSSQYVDYKVFMLKPRGCLYITDSEVGYAKVKGVWQEVLFNYVDDNTPGSSKPVSLFDKTSYGVWRWETPPGTTAVRTTVLHDCGGDIRITTIGPHQTEDRL